MRALNETVTTQQTAKKFKLLQLIGLAGCVGGILSVYYLPGSGASIIFPIGLVIFVIGRGLAWWHHG